MRSVLLVLLTGCTAAAPDAWVASNNDVAVAVLRDGDAGLAYSCGATADSVKTHTHWYDDIGWSDGTLTRDDGWTIELVEDGDDLDVVLIDPDGNTEALLATPADQPLYEHTGTCRDGAIVTSDGLVGSWCDALEVAWQVEPVELLDVGAPELLLQPVGTNADPFTALPAIP